MEANDTIKNSLMKVENSHGSQDTQESPDKNPPPKSNFPIIRDD
jgi:hypothetical protein